MTNCTNNPPKQNATPKFTDLVEKLSQVQLGLKQNLENLKQNLGQLETERQGVLFELETMRKDSKTRAEGLEEDVNRLRLEIEDLRDVLGLKKETD